jgi:hypothetical protein
MSQVPSPAKSDRQRETDEEDARWEARLRQLSARKSLPGVGTARAPSPPRKTSLQLVSSLTRRDALLLPRSVPGFSGSEPDDFICGKCSGLIGSRVSPTTIRGRHPEGERLVVRCVCGALNLVSVTSTR